MNCLLVLLAVGLCLCFTKRHIDLLSTTNIHVPEADKEITFIDFMRKVSTKNTMCSDFSSDEIKCDFDYNCSRSLKNEVECFVNPEIECEGPHKFNKTFICQYCWQLPEKNIFCTKIKDCISDLELFRSTCQVKDDTICLGNRKFHKNLTCEFTSGKIWFVALLFSIFLGGLGVDRCYLGYWGWAFLKFCTCGGLCVWTVLDTFLIAANVLGPSDGSVYWQ